LTLKPAKLRPQAEQDLVDTARYYVQVGGHALGAKMFDAGLAALETIQHEPGIGSPRIGQFCDIRGLRSWRVSGFPAQWFYFETDSHLDVARLLGDRQDIAAILTEEG
jgi:toxin ParE1/3/4